MNPYLATGLAMCVVILIALIGTGYLAVYFTRRAKADVERLITPLAESLEEGVGDAEEAEVKGKYHGALVFGRMARAAAGTVTLWQTDLIDSAGGQGWNFVYSRPNPKKTNPEAEVDIITESDVVRSWLETWTAESIASLQPLETDWVQVEYTPESGVVRVARPIKGRNQIPAPETFLSDLAFAEQIGNRNRELQQTEGARDGE